MNTISKRIALILAAAGSAALIGGCSSAVHGTVTGKDYLAGYTTYTNTPVYGQHCTTTEEEEEEPDGKGEEPEEEPETTCTSYVEYYHLVPYYHSACYRLTVSGSQGGTECVSASTYSATKIGSAV